MGDLQVAALKAKILKDQQQGKAAMFNGLASLAKAALGKRELEADVVDMLLGHQKEARQLGFEHGHRHNEQLLSARDHGHRHGMDISQHRHQVGQDLHNAAMDVANQQQGGEEGTSGGAGIGGEATERSPSGAPTSAEPQASPPASPQPGGLPPGSEIE